MSTITIGGTPFHKASYLIRVAADLGGKLQVMDMDVHVRIDLDNTSADELTSALTLAGSHDLQIDCYEDNHKTHLFEKIRYDGRVVCRTPKTKYALLRFRYPAPGSPSEQPGWIDLTPTAGSVQRVTAHYPDKHAKDKLYPEVHLEHGSVVHYAGLSNLDIESKQRSGDSVNLDAGAEPVLEPLPKKTDARALNALIMADHPDGSGVKLGLHSFRSIKCPWLDAIFCHDAYWRTKPDGQAKPLTLTITSPENTNGSVITLEGMNPGRLFYTESEGALSRAIGILPNSDRFAHDEWELGQSDDRRLLQQLSVASLGGPPLSAWDIAGHGYRRSGETNRAPVEMVIIEFDKPNVPTGQKFFENLST